MADEKELEKIRQLPPKQRLKLLQELEEKRKKQEDEAKKIIEQSLKEIKLDEMLEEIEVPKQQKVEIDRLFEKSNEVEEQAAAARKKLDADGGSDYNRRIQALLPQNMQEEIRVWYARDNVPPTKSEFLEVYNQAREAYNLVQQSMHTAPNKELYSSPSSDLVENVVGSMRLLRSMGYKMNWFGPGGGA